MAVARAASRAQRAGVAHREVVGEAAVAAVLAAPDEEAQVDSGGQSQVCLDIAAEYARELPRFLACSGQQTCGNRVNTAPGCICEIHVQEPAPLALETLMNVAQKWFDEHCTNPVCTTPCPAANRGACQNGRCVTLP